MGANVSSAPVLREATGGNRTDAALIVLLRGMLAERDDEINEALAVLPDVLKTVKAGDGFYADGSFIQHGDIPYTGTYGNVLLEGLGRIMALMADSSWSERYPELLCVYDALPDSFMPFLYAGQMMDMQNGRAVSREERQNHVEGHGVLSSMVRLTGSAPPEARKKLAGFVKAQLQVDTSRDFLADQTNFQVHATARQILDDGTLGAAEPLRGPRLDRMVWHGKDYAVGLAWHSWRTGNFECMNDENRKGWFIGDGAVYVYDSDLLQYTDYWPLISPCRIAGTTLDTETELKNADKTTSRVGSNRNARIQWAGGTVLGSNATVGLEFYNHDDSVSALKSWFILNDKIIAVGSDIQSGNGKKTAMVVDSRKLNASSGNAILINGRSWDRANSQDNMDGVETVHIVGNVSGSAMGYWFSGGASVSPEYAHVAGNWADIRTKDTGSSDRIAQDHVFPLLILHHAGHANFYRYVIMSGASSQAL